MPAVSVRQYRLFDDAALFEAAVESRQEVFPFLPWCRPNLTQDDCRSWITTQVAAFDAGTAYEFVIEDEGCRYLGGIGVNQIDAANHRANLGYWVRTSATRQGVATEAIQQVVQWAFDATDLIRIEVVVSTQNAPSLRTAERSGAVREGVLRKRLWLHGVAHDAVMFSFVRS